MENSMNMSNTVFPGTMAETGTSAADGHGGDQQSQSQSQPDNGGPQSSHSSWPAQLAASLDSPLDSPLAMAVDAEGVHLQAQAAYSSLHHTHQLHAGRPSASSRHDAHRVHGGHGAHAVAMVSIDDDHVHAMDITPMANPPKRKRRPSSLPSIDSLLLIPPPSSDADHGQQPHARTPPPNSERMPTLVDNHPAAVALAAEAHAAVHLESLSLAAPPCSQPTSPLLTPLDPLASLLSPPRPSSSPSLPATPVSPITPTPFRRARGGSSAPRPSSLLAKLDHLPMELLHLVAEYVAATCSASSSADTDPMLVPRPHTQLAHLARACKRVCAAVLPVLYTVPAVESLVQLRRLVVSLQVSAVRTLARGDGAACQVHPSCPPCPVFAYVRGLDIARLEDGARGKREVAALVTRVVRVARARTADDVKQWVTLVGWAGVDPTLGGPACTCSLPLAPGGAEWATAAAEVVNPTCLPPSPSLRRVASNGHLTPKPADSPTAACVYGMDLSSSPTPPSPIPPNNNNNNNNTEYLPTPRLTHLNLSFAKSLTPTLLSSVLLPHTLRLTHLNLSGTHLPDAQLATLLTQSAHTLVRVSLAWNPHLTDLSLASLAPGGRAGAPALRITHLDLTHCRDLSDWSLAKLAPSLPLLRALSVAWCPRISGRVVHAALSYWPHLKALSVAGCPRVGGREAVRRMWEGYVVADVELRARVGRVSRLVGGAGERGQVGLVERCERLMVDEPGMGGCVYYLDV